MQGRRVTQRGRISSARGRVSSHRSGARRRARPPSRMAALETLAPRRAAPQHAALAVPVRPGERSMNFARTKIQPPRPRGGALLERPALEQRLAAALQRHRLVLVSAAAGYGKTTALARAAAHLPAGAALAWVAADEGDDLHRLLECLFAALEPFDPPWRTAPEALVAQAEEARGRTRAAGELINALEASDTPHGVLVLDDLHRVDDGAFFDFLAQVLERLGPRWTLAIATREDPPLPLARLRAAGELAEFRQHDLQFDDAEAEALAVALGRQADVLHWQARTHGWPAGLRLALAGADARTPRGSDRAVFDFLATEVIARLEPGLRRFLLHTAVLPELSAGRAAAVSGNPDAAWLIEQVERLGLFVTALEAPEPTLKLHDLFRDALLQQLRREEPATLPQLCRRAAAGEPDPARRLALLLQAGDLDAAAELLLGQAPALLTEGALSAVAHGIDQFPGDYVAASPAMQMVLGQLAWARWDFPAMVQAMQRAEDGFAGRGDGERERCCRAYRALALNALGRLEESAALLASVRRESLGTEARVVMLVACLWHAMDLGSMHRVGPLLDELMDHLERSDDPSMWYRGHPLPRMNGVPGTVPALRRFVDGALRLAGDRPLPLRALAHAQEAWHRAWHEGDLAAAEAALSTAQDDCRWLGDPPNVKGSLLLLDVFVQTLAGRRAQALATAQAMLEQHPQRQGAWSLWALRYYGARIAAAFDDEALLAARLEQLEAGVAAGGGDSPQRLLEPLRGHRARLAGDRATAIAHWQRALADPSALHRLGHADETRVWLAAALLEQGHTEAAAAALAPTLQPDAPQGPLCMARGALARLRQADWQGHLAPAAVARLERACAPLAGPAAEPLLEGGLSAREAEVLARIAAGDSNKLIARAFDLSPHTVKRHVANILDKLGLDSRGQAAAWYRQRA